MQGKKGGYRYGFHQCVKIAEKILLKEEGYDLINGSNKIFEIVCNRVGLPNITGTFVLDYIDNIAMTWQGHESGNTTTEFPYDNDTERGLIRKVKRSGNYHVINSMSRDNNLEGYVYYSANLQSEIAFPIYLYGDVIGVIDIASTKPNAFGEEDIGWLQDVSIVMQMLLLALNQTSQFTVKLEKEQNDDDLLDYVLRYLLKNSAPSTAFVYLHIVDEDRVVPYKAISKRGKIKSTFVNRSNDKAAWSELLGVTGKAVRLKQTINVPSVVEDKDYFPFREQEEAQVKSEVAIPIIWGTMQDEQEVIGVVDVVATQKEAFDADVQLKLEQLVEGMKIPFYIAQLKKKQELERRALGNIAYVAPTFIQSNPHIQIYKEVVETAIRLIPTATVCHLLRVESIDEASESMKFTSNISESVKTQYLKIKAIKIRGNSTNEEDLIDRYGKFSVSRGITGTSVRSKQQQYIKDVRPYSKEEAFIKFRAQTISELAIPLILGDSVLGVINLESDTLDAFSQRDKDIAQLLATTAVCAIASAEQYLVDIERRKVVNTTLTKVIEAMKNTRALEESVITHAIALTEMEDCKGSLLIINKDKRSLLRGYRNDAYGRNVEFEASLDIDPLVHSAINDKKIVNISTKDEKVDPSYFSANIRSRLVIPLVEEGNQVIYALDLTSQSLDAFSSKIVKDLKIFGDFVLKALNNMAFVDELGKTLAKVVNLTELEHHNLGNQLKILKEKVLKSNAEGLSNQQELEEIINGIEFVLRIGNTRVQILGNTLEFSPSPQDIYDLVNETISKHSKHQRISLMKPRDPQDVFAFADRSLLQMALIELIDNAVKYSELESVINIRVERIAKDVDILIENTGKIIPVGDRERIFEYGQRGSGITPDSGHGFGLFLVRKAMKEQNGTVYVESLPDESGNRFVLELLAHIKSSNQ